MPDEVRVQSNGAYWQAVIVDHLGRAKAKSIGRKDAMTKRQAMKAARIWAAEHADNPIAATARAITLLQWRDRYVATRTDISPLTLSDHDRTLTLLSHHFGDLEVRRLGRPDAKDFRVWLESQPGRGDGNPTMSEATVRKHIRNCKTIFGAAVDEGWRTDNPFSKEKSSVPETPNDWQYVDLETFGRLLEELPIEYRTAAALARLAGLRLSEATFLRWSDINWSDRTITVRIRGGRATTKQRHRTVPIAPQLHDLLTDALLMGAFEMETPDLDLDHVAPLAGENLQRPLRRAAERIGAAWAKPFHTLRKNCETDWLASYPVMDVCRWLGHSPAVAMRHYHQTTASTMRRAAGLDTTPSPAEAEINRLRAARRRTARRLRQLRANQESTP